MSTGSQYPKNLDQHSEIGGKDIPRHGVVSSPEVEWLATSNISNLGPREPLGQQLWKYTLVLLVKSGGSISESLRQFPTVYAIWKQGVFIVMPSAMDSKL